MISYYVHKYSLLLSAVVMALFISSCTSKQNKSDNSNEVDSTIDTISVSEAVEEMREERANEVHGEVDIFQEYVTNRVILESDTAACNRGPEPFKQFVAHFSKDSSFRESRIRLCDGSESVSVDTDENDLIQHNPDDEGFFSAWSIVRADSVVFTSGWLNSEVAEEYTFARGDNGLWFLVEYFNINDSQA